MLTRDLDEAERSLLAAQRCVVDVFGPMHPHAAAIEDDLGRLFFRRGSDMDRKIALQYFESARRTNEAVR